MKRVISKVLIMFFIIAGGLAVVTPHSMAAGVTVHKDGDKYVKLGGRIQLQYHSKDPKADGEESTDKVFFRRFRPYIEGSIHKNWKGKFQWDMGKAEDGNEIAIKDAYMQYKGIKNLKISIGNQYFPFSREALTSSKKQQLIERTFVGDHNYGTPDRSAGIKFDGNFGGEKFTYGLALASSSIDPDAKKLDFDTPVNANKDFNQGLIAGGRIDFHPFGKLKFSQGDFKGKTKATIGVAAFTWNNDDDNNTRFCDGKDRKSCDSAKSDYSKGSGKPDVDSVTGLEISGAFRISGFSIDAQYNRFKADTIDGSVTSGIYKDGTTTLKNMAVEGGYMVIPAKFEIVAGYQIQDADSYDEQWKRTSVGANWFFEKHDIKTQITYRMGENLKGKEGSDEDELFVQMQYVF